MFFIIAFYYYKKLFCLYSGIIGKKKGIVGCDGSTDTGQSIACPNGKNISVPMPIDKATTACDCNGDCQFFIKYK